jgi:hypothetical protein
MAEIRTSSVDGATDGATRVPRGRGRSPKAKASAAPSVGTTARPADESAEGTYGEADGADVGRSGAGEIPDSTTQSQPTNSTDEDASVRVIRLTAIDREALISMTAYFRAQQRNFEPGQELDDWLAAEAEVDAQLSAGSE